MRLFTAGTYAAGAVALFVGLGCVPSAEAMPTPTPRYVHKEHVTQLGYRVNDPCPRGTYKYFVAHAAAWGAGIVSYGQHGLKLTDGTTLRSVPGQSKTYGSQIEWFFPRASRFAKVSPYLSGSRVELVTLAKYLDHWSDYVSRTCHS